jgi:hypothetical protein
MAPLGQGSLPVRREAAVVAPRAPAARAPGAPFAVAPALAPMLGSMGDGEGGARRPPSASRTRKTRCVHFAARTGASERESHDVVGKSVQRPV